MTRAEIAEKFKYVASKMPEPPKEGDCYEMKGMPIKEQLKKLGEGKGKIFFLKIVQASFDDTLPQINMHLVSENVYISPTKYV